MVARVPALTTRRRARVRFTTILGVTAMLATQQNAEAQPVALDVHVTITDLNNAPLRDTPVRLVLGDASLRASPDAGTRLVTDAKGEFRFSTRAVLEARRVKRPTNFVSSLLSGKEAVRHLTVAAEMPYMQYHWLYAFDVDRFDSDGACLQSGVSIFTRDAKGHFSVAGTRDKTGSWSVAELNGMMMTRAPYEPSNFLLQPVSSRAGETHWTLDVAFKKSPDAVRR